MKKYSVKEMVKEFGGLRKAAREIGRAPSAVHRWTVNNKIPLSAINDVVRAKKRVIPHYAMPMRF